MDTITALALSFSLMVAYYGVRKAWKKVTYKPPRQRQIDPVGEAEVFLAYGRVGDAVRVLKDTLKEEPNNLPAKLTLLRAYSHAEDSKAYSRLAKEVSVPLQNQAVWQTIQEHGRRLDPSNPLFHALH